jgi:hypothetical protein
VARAVFGIKPADIVNGKYRTPSPDSLCEAVGWRKFSDWAALTKASSSPREGTSGTWRVGLV